MRLVFGTNSGRSLIEIVFSIAIIIVIFGVFAGYWIKTLEESREVVLENQLTNLKYSLELYMMLEGQYPKDLRELSKRYVGVKENKLYGRRYLEHQVQDEEGYPIGPYGRRFIYDKKTGKVKRRQNDS